jgi:hypothetical protein
MLGIVMTTITLSVGQADSLTHPGEPLGGVQRLALSYYKINFTKEQRKELEGIEIEFLYNVTGDGQATLEKINGINDPFILDSLQHASISLPQFYPLMVNDSPQSFAYFMKIQFPKFTWSEFFSFNNRLSEFTHAKYNDFEYIQTPGLGFEALFSAGTNIYMGAVHNYLTQGLATKFDLTITTNRKFGGSMVIGIYESKIRKEFPIISDRDQDKKAYGASIGIGLNTKIYEKKRSRLLMQLELQVITQSLSQPLNDKDKNFILLTGFSPGISAHYSWRFGKPATSNYYFKPVLFSNMINIYVAIRPVFFKLKEATGIMAEAGIGYRFRLAAVSDYKLRVQN